MVVTLNIITEILEVSFLLMQGLSKNVGKQNLVKIQDV